MGYRPGEQVHWIQARKAWEDHETWIVGAVESVEGRQIRVGTNDGASSATFESDGAPLVAASGETEVWFTTRWSVMAFRTDRGNVIGLVDPEDAPPGSVFRLAGTRRLHFISIKRAEPVEYVYAAALGLGGRDVFFALPRPYAEYVAEVMRIMNTCKTWGEVRAEASKDLYEEILGQAGYGDLDDDAVGYIRLRNPMPGSSEGMKVEWVGAETLSVPADDDPFVPMEIDSYSCGDYPPPFESLQNSVLPDDLIRRFGSRYETSINGTFAELHPETGPELIAELERRGHRCVEETEMFEQSMERR